MHQAIGKHPHGSQPFDTPENFLFELILVIQMTSTNIVGILPVLRFSVVRQAT